MATQLSILTAVLPGHRDELERTLTAIPLDVDSPFATLRGTHNGRFALISTDPAPAASLRAGGLPTPMLMCSATIDIQPAEWLPLLLVALGDRAEAVWSHCAGWSTAIEKTQFLIAHRVHSALEFATWDAPVDRVRRALDTRRRLTALVLQTQGADPATLLAAYRKEMGR
jgi:hypothetical protein